MGLAQGPETMCETDCLTFNEVVDYPKRLLCVIRPVMPEDCSALPWTKEVKPTPLEKCHICPTSLGRPVNARGALIKLITPSCNPFCKVKRVAP
jgi:hypothetical protein